MVRKQKPWPKSLAQQKNDFTSEGAPVAHTIDRGNQAPPSNAQPAKPKPAPPRRLPKLS